VRTNDSPEGRNANRRVLLVILSGVADTPDGTVVLPGQQPGIESQASPESLATPGEPATPAAPQAVTQRLPKAFPVPRPSAATTLPLPRAVTPGTN
jgi:hypothetical protein